MQVARHCNEQIILPLETGAKPAGHNKFQVDEFEID